MGDSVAALQTELGGIEHLDVQADRRVERGGTIVQTEYGEVDAAISTQLAGARAIVKAALAGDDHDDGASDDEDDDDDVIFAEVVTPGTDAAAETTTA
jgi:hypothetical protein